MCALVTIRTSGDEIQDREISAHRDVNVFTAEVDRAVADSRADAGVHSLKDLGTQLAGGLDARRGARARPGRGRARRASRSGRSRACRRGRPSGPAARAAGRCCSRERPDLRCVDLRGNVETRLAKVERGEVEAAVLARARARAPRTRPRDHAGPPARPVPPRRRPGSDRDHVPRGDERVSSRRSARSATSRASPRASPSARCSRALHAGCHAPVGALAIVEGEPAPLRCRILSRDGTSEISGSIEGPGERRDPAGSGPRAAPRSPTARDR